MPSPPLDYHDDFIKWKHFRVTGPFCREFTGHRCDITWNTSNFRTYVFELNNLPNTPWISYLKKKTPKNVGELVQPEMFLQKVICLHHYNDAIMGATASQITSLTIVCSTVYSGADQRKHQSSASLAFVRGIHRWPVNSPHKWPVTRKMFPFNDVIMWPRLHDLFLRRQSSQID